MKTLDEAIHEAGGFGICQIVFVTAATIFTFLTGANMGASIYEAYVPPSNCKSPFANEAYNICSDYQPLLLPMEDGVLSQCYRYHFTNMTYELVAHLVDSNRTSCDFQVNSTTTDIIRCDNWEYDQTVMASTIVTDFDLVCGSRWGGYLSQSALMAGVGLGNILTGYVSDRFGRRLAILIISAGMCITGGLLSITKTFLAYSITRAFLGLFAYGPFLVLFVHALELTIPKYRSAVAQALEISFPFGFAYLTLVSYLLRGWRNVQLAISLPAVTGILIWWLAPESPRWLMMKNRTDEAAKVLSRIARINKTTMESKERIELVPEESESTAQPSNALKLVFKTPRIRSVTLRMFYNWFAVSCVYYGLTMNAAELSGDPFVNLLINAAAEAVAVVLTIPLVNICGRRMTGSLSEISAGVLCITIQIISHPTASTVLAIMGKFAISISFSTMFITASEIYPTEIRNFATGLCSAMARLGGVVSPLIAMMGMLNRELPYVTFGLLALLAGLLILTLPETKDVPLTQTIEEGVDFLKKNSGACPSIKIRRPLGCCNGDKA